MTKVVYLSGASGFIGSHIRSAAGPDVQVRPITREMFSGNGEGLRFEAGATVIHLAAKVHDMRQDAGARDDYFRINTEMSVALAQAALRSGARQFIYFSSLKVFGDSRKGYVDGTMMPEPDEPYGQSKLQAEKKLEGMFSGQSSCQCIVLRLSMVYGPGNKGNMIPLLKMAARGIPLPLAGARGKRSMVYVGNVASAVQAIIGDARPGRPAFQVYELCDGSDLTSAELYSLIFQEFRQGRRGVFYVPDLFLRAGAHAASLVERVIGVRLPFNRSVYDRLFSEYRTAVDRFRKDYGWEPPFSPPQGVTQTVAWFREQVASAGRKAASGESGL